MNNQRADATGGSPSRSGIKNKLAMVMAALAVLGHLSVTSAQAQAPTLQLSRVVVPAGSTTSVTITGVPGQNFAVLGSSRGAGLSYAGVNFAVGADMVILAVGNLSGTGTASITVTPPFLGTELDRYYIQVATSPAANFVPLQLSAGQVLLNGDLAPLAALVAAGPQGPQGPQGPAGATGAPGSAGAAGATGAAGPVGPAGSTGAAGAVGPQGSAGVAGSAGPAGPAGANGSDGAVGPQGPAGTNGNDGAAGVQGATGVAGPQGPAGVAGVAGPQGPVGAPGPAGANGNDGATGAAGAQGAAGPVGPAGANGNDGATGATGAQGVAGATGAAGPAGPAGANGNDGATGAQGAAGATGAQGAAGPVGATGATGAGGAQGPMGLQGPVGPGNAGFINPVAGSISVNSTTDVVVATLTNLPAGSYLLSGKANIIKTGATANFTTCALKNGATVLDQLQNQTSTSGELSVLSGSVTLAAPATITMTCRVSAASTTMAAQFRVLTAFKVNTLTVQ